MPSLTQQLYSTPLPAPVQDPGCHPADPGTQHNPRGPSALGRRKEEGRESVGQVKDGVKEHLGGRSCPPHTTNES